MYITITYFKDMDKYTGHPQLEIDANNIQIHNQIYHKLIILDQEEQYLNFLIETSPTNFYMRLHPYNVITNLLHIKNQLLKLAARPVNVSLNFRGSTSKKVIDLIQNSPKQTQPQRLEQMAWDHNILQIDKMTEREKDFMKTTATQKAINRKQHFYIMDLWDKSLKRTLTKLELQQMNEDQITSEMDVDINYEIHKLQKTLEVKRRTVIWKNMDLIWANNTATEKKRYQQQITEYLHRNNEWEDGQKWKPPQRKEKIIQPMITSRNLMWKPPQYRYYNIRENRMNNLLERNQLTTKQQFLNTLVKQHDDRQQCSTKSKHHDKTTKIKSIPRYHTRKNNQTASE